MFVKRKQNIFFKVRKVVQNIVKIMILSLIIVFSLLDLPKHSEKHSENRSENNGYASPRPYVVFSTLFGMFGTSTSFCLELPNLPQGFLLSLTYGKAVPEARICGKRRYTENFDFEVTWEGHFYYIRVHFFSKRNILLPL